MSPEVARELVAMYHEQQAREQALWRAGVRPAPIPERPPIEPAFEPPSKGWVYFVEAVKLDRIKIGFSSQHPTKGRLSGLQGMSPVKLKLLMAIEGDVKLERELHKRFARARTHGEWFVLTADILAFIREQAETTPEMRALGPLECRLECQSTH